MTQGLVLAIETSCDETCCAILDHKGNVLSNTVFSQAEIHSEFGGVLPDVASKNHTEKITYVIEKSLKESGLALEEIKKVFIHQANMKMDESIVKRLFKLYNKELPENILPMNIQSLGNSSVATIPLPPKVG